MHTTKKMKSKSTKNALEMYACLLLMLKILYVKLLFEYMVNYSIFHYAL